MVPGRRLQLAAVVVFFIAYSVLSHYSNSHPKAQNLGAVLSFAPMLTLGLVLIWRWSGALVALLVAAGLAWLLHEFWSLVTQNFSLVYLIQECGFYAIMAWSFARSLFKGRVPLCTQLADKVHGPLSALELSYTRKVTVAWAIFFLTNLALMFLLFEFAPSQIWSLYVNFLMLPMILLMFAIEYTVRRRVLPQVKRSSLIDTLRVYFSNPR
ncbi:MAG: hypothetical protein M3O26_21220 [Pseudomonadota bacterium]|nr:hypothetical protein [Pseudomonadota bacterium]